VICLAPRVPGEIVGPRRLSGVVVRPLNFTVRQRERYLCKSLIALLVAALGVPELSGSQSPSDQVASGRGADALIQELRELPAAIGPEIRSDGRPIPEEVQRHRLYEQLRDLGSKVALPALRAP
jgi:hypothetical protein